MIQYKSSNFAKLAFVSDYVDLQQVDQGIFGGVYPDPASGEDSLTQGNILFNGKVAPLQGDILMFVGSVIGERLC